MLTEGKESAVLTVQSGSGYSVGTANAATVTIENYGNFFVPEFGPRYESLTSPLAAGMSGNVANAVSDGSVRFPDGAVYLPLAVFAQNGVAPAGGDVLEWTNTDVKAQNHANGNGVVNAQRPYLKRYNAESLSLVRDSLRTDYFDYVSGQWDQRYYGRDLLSEDATNHLIVITDSTGTVARYHDFTSAWPESQQGQIKDSTDRAGNVTAYTYFGGSLTERTVAETIGGQTRTLSYTYAYLGGGDPNAGKIASVTYRSKVNSGSWTVHLTTTYEYHRGTDAHGTLGDLKHVTLKDANGTALSTSYFRYYLSDGTNGLRGRLKYAILGDSFARMAATTGSSMWALSDATISPYATRSYEYDANWRVTRVTTWPGSTQGTFTFAYATAENTPDANSWVVRTTETQPDGTVKKYFANAFGETLFTSEVNAGQTWNRFYRYDAQGRLTYEADAAAVAGFSESLPDLIGYSSNSTNLHDDLGVVRTYAYGTSSGGGDGPGYLKQVSIKRGEQGTPSLQLSQTYTARTAGGFDVFFPAETTTYRNDDGTGALTTVTGYTWQGSTATPATVAVTAPAVLAPEQNGSGNPTATVAAFGATGRRNWDKDQNGSITYTEYDPATGAVVKQIRDVNTTLGGTFIGSAPWTSLTGLHLTSTFEVDAFGRTTKATDPLGNVTYTVYNDAAHEVRTYPGWIPSLNKPTGPTVVVRQDWARGYVETLTMTATPAVSGGRPTGAEAIGNLQSLSRSQTNPAGQVVTEDRYHDLTGLTYSPATALGAINTNFYRTTYQYDAGGRRGTTIDPAGANRTTVFDGLGRPVSDWVNGVKVKDYEYDGGTVGNGNLTKTVEYPGASQPNRETRYSYDWRNRLVAVKVGAETTEGTAVNRPITYTDYDNLNRPTRVRVFDGDGVTLSSSNGVPQAPADSLLRAMSKTYYDERGQVYKTEEYPVDPGKGTVGSTPAVTNTWYDARGSVIKVTGPSGMSVKNLYDAAGRLIHVYEVDAAGDSGYADAGNVSGDTVHSWTSTFRDANGNVNLKFDPNGNYTTYAYDRAGRLVTETDAYGNNWYFYDNAGNLSATWDELEDVTGYLYDALGRKTVEINPLLDRTTYAYDGLGRVVSVTDAEENETTYEYDPSGLFSVEIDPYSKRTTTAYDALGRTVSVRDRLNNLTQTAYDTVGRILTQTDAKNKVTTYGYDTLGNRTSVKDPRNKTAHSEFDSFGFETASVDALGNRTTYVYDLAGNLTGMIDARGNRTTYTYDIFGQMTRVEDARHNVTTYTYNAARLLASVTDARNNTTSYQYNARGQTTVVNDPYNQRTTTTYFADGDIHTVTDPMNRVTTYIYDDAGFRTGVQTAAGTTWTVYNDDGSVHSVTDPLGHTMTHSYNDNGWLEWVQDPEGNYTYYEYDDDGNLEFLTDASGNVTYWHYDANGNVDYEIDANNKMTTYAYDDNNNRIGKTDRNGRVATYVYDAVNRLVQETVLYLDTSNLIGGNVAPVVTYGLATYHYDAAGNLDQVIHPNGRYTITYDTLNRPTNVQEPFDVWLDFGYDEVGNRTTVSDPWGYGVTTTSTYDKNNRLTSRHMLPEGSGGVYHTKFDLAYNPGGDLTTLTRYDASDGVTPSVRTTYNYDAVGRIQNARTYAVASNATISAYTYAYDAASRLTSVVDNGTTKTYGYDDAGQLTNDNGTGHTYDATGNRTGSDYVTGDANRIAEGDGFSYLYDNEGNVTQRTDTTTGEYFNYVYDLDNRLLLAYRTWSGTSVIHYSYDYDGYGNRIRQTDYILSPTNVVARWVKHFAYDGWDTAKPQAVGNENFDVWLDFTPGRSDLGPTHRTFGPGFDDLVAVNTMTDSYPDAPAWYDVDKLGSVRRVVDHTGSVLSATTFDAFGKLVSGTLYDRYGFAGREWDSNSSLYYSRARVYDPGIGRFYSEDPARDDEVNLYRYVGNGPTNGRDPSGLQDPYRKPPVTRYGTKAGLDAYKKQAEFFEQKKQDWRMLESGEYLPGKYIAAKNDAYRYHHGGLLALGELTQSIPYYGIEGVAHTFYSPLDLSLGGVELAALSIDPNYKPALNIALTKYYNGEISRTQVVKDFVADFAITASIIGPAALEAFAARNASFYVAAEEAVFLRNGGFGTVQQSDMFFLRNNSRHFFKAVVPESVTTKPTVQPGAIGLGLDHKLLDLNRMGAKTYNKWFEFDLTRVRPEQANLSPFKFKQAFTEAAEKAPQIIFDLTDLDVSKALVDGAKGFIGKNYTNAELHHIATNNGLLGKTTFINKGRAVKPVIIEGNLIGFVP